MTPVNAVLGAWRVRSPWAAGHSDSVANANAVVVGLALVAVALGAMLVPQAWQEWTEATLGLFIRSVNVVPSQIEQLILKQPGLRPHYVLELSKYAPMDALTV
jgi:hypothetical protein